MGRRPSASAHRRVLDAARGLFAERGIETTSMDAIAAASGVSKATIYKHWADKEALLLEVMAGMSGVHKRPAFDSGNTRGDMIAVLAYRPPENAEMRERILPHFIAYSARNPAFGMAWRKTVLEPPRRELTHLMKLGIARHELCPDLDIDLSLALLLGPILYWHVLLKGASDEAPPPAEAVVDAFWRAFGRRRMSRNQRTRRTQPTHDRTE